MTRQTGSNLEGFQMDMKLKPETDYVKRAFVAITKGYEAEAERVECARLWVLNADAIPEEKVDAMRAALKQLGNIDPSTISRWCGKPGKTKGSGGLWAIGRYCPSDARKVLDGPLKNVTSVHNLYKGLKSVLKQANAVTTASSGDLLADAESLATAQHAAKVDAAGRSVGKNLGMLSTQQIIGALMTHAAGLTKPEDRLAFYAEVSNAMLTASKDLQATIAKNEKEPAKV